MSTLKRKPEMTKKAGQLLDILLAVLVVLKIFSLATTSEANDKKPPPAMESPNKAE